MPEGTNPYPVYPNLTECQCPLPGYCERHGCDKPDALHRQCQTNPQWFALWEEGRGPGQTMPDRCGPCRELGSLVGEETCDSCRGQVRIKVFDCRLHGHCSLSQKLTSLRCCVTCADYQPAKQSAEPSILNA